MHLNESGSFPLTSTFVTKNVFNLESARIKLTQYLITIMLLFWSSVVFRNKSSGSKGTQKNQFHCVIIVFLQNDKLLIICEKKLSVILVISS